ncbi:MAG: hypothetical protein LQ339_004597 [Xanthoria mediterranea]|nr:MAG: hypothetical protein LQ339_004597 [Xanthoria mediterranea]
MASVSKGFSFVTYNGSPSRRIIKVNTQRDGLREGEVLIRITHSSLCGTDEHYLGKDMCLGHEGAGVVVKLGPGIQHLKVDDNVAFGYQRSCCGTCSHCLQSLEIFCPSRAFYGFSEPDIGSMASHIPFQESFTYKIPPGISNGEASALMCGGATVFNVLDMFSVKPTDRVGVVGIGGLGHLAILFASKWGCEVVVFSSSEKREDAMRFGATEFHVTKGVGKFENIDPIDQLLVTTSQQIPWGLYLPIMASPGTIYPLTLSEQDLQIPYPAFLFNGIRIQASIVAPRVISKRMLKFAAFHNIAPILQFYPLDEAGIEEAMADLRLGKTRYRGVLCAKD